MKCDFLKNHERPRLTISINNKDFYTTITKVHVENKGNKQPIKLRCWDLNFKRLTLCFHEAITNSTT